MDRCRWITSSTISSNWQIRVFSTMRAIWIIVITALSKLMTLRIPIKGNLINRPKTTAMKTKGTIRWRSRSDRSAKGLRRLRFRGVRRHRKARSLLWLIMGNRLPKTEGTILSNNVVHRIKNKDMVAAHDHNTKLQRNSSNWNSKSASRIWGSSISRRVATLIDITIEALITSRLA